MLKGLKVYIQHENSQNPRKRKRNESVEPSSQNLQSIKVNAPALSVHEQRKKNREGWMTLPPDNLFGGAKNRETNETRNPGGSSEKSSQHITVALPKYDLEGKLITTESMDENRMNREFANEYARMGRVKNDEFAFGNEGTTASSTTGSKRDDTSTDVAANKQQQLLRQAQIKQHHHIENVLSSCKYCRKGPQFRQHLMVSMGNYTYLALPPYGSFVEGHCIISTLEHKVAATLMDENELHEIDLFKHHLQQMFLKQEKYCIFIETITRTHRSKQLHSFIECIPVPVKLGQQGSAYFHQSISELGSDWSQNKKLIQTKCGKTLRSYIPTNFPYFHVEFGRKGGLVHVIEGDDFSFLFGREVICGMLGMTPDQLKTRSPGAHQEAILVQFFLDQWSKNDWTMQLDGGEMIPEVDHEKSG